MKNIINLHWAHWLVIALSFILTMGAWYFAQTQVNNKQDAQFKRAVDTVHELLNIRMQKYEDALWGGVATIQSQSNGLDHHEWKRFADVLNIEDRYPGINGIGVIYAVDKNNAQTFIANEKINRPEFEIHPPHNSTECFPITYIEPIESNRAALGLDMAHEKNRYEAVKIARRTGNATITGPIVLVQDNAKTPGFLFHAPFYKDNMNAPFMTEEERVNDFKGTVYAPFIFHKLIEGLLEKDKRDVLIRVRDGSHIMYDEIKNTPIKEDGFYSSQQDNFYGRVWTIDVTAAPLFYNTYENRQPLFILIGGIFIELLLIYLLLALARAREQALGEAKRKTDRLSKRENELEMIFNNVPVKIWYKDDQNTILRLNKMAATGMGGAIEDFEGKNTYDLFPEIAKKYHDDDLEVIRSNTPKLGIVEEFKPIGAAHSWVRTDKVPYTDPITGKEMILVVSQDITKIMEADIEREQLIEKLAESNEELERFAYIASHDLQEPLRMVRSYTQLLERRYKSQLDDDAIKYIQFASDAAIRMQALIEDLLDYAKMSDNSDKYVEIDCNTVVEYVVENLEAIISEKDATLDIDPLPTILANEVRIARLFQNLIGNALKYSKQGEKPHVRLRFTDKDTHYEFAIKDNGIGMKQQYLNQIFEPFKRLHGKTEYPGTGIGLAICYKIVDGFGGKIWANSEIGKGSTFYFTIPKHKA